MATLTLTFGYPGGKLAKSLEALPTYFRMMEQSHSMYLFLQPLLKLCGFLGKRSGSQELAPLGLNEECFMQRRVLHI